MASSPFGDGDVDAWRHDVPFRRQVVDDRAALDQEGTLAHRQRGERHQAERAVRHDEHPRCIAEVRRHAIPDLPPQCRARGPRRLRRSRRRRGAGDVGAPLRDQRIDRLARSRPARRQRVARRATRTPDTTARAGPARAGGRGAEPRAVGERGRPVVADERQQRARRRAMPPAPARRRPGRGCVRRGTRRSPPPAPALPLRFPRGRGRRAPCTVWPSSSLALGRADWPAAAVLRASPSSCRSVRRPDPARRAAPRGDLVQHQRPAADHAVDRASRNCLGVAYVASEKIRSRPSGRAAAYWSACRSGNVRSIRWRWSRPRLSAARGASAAVRRGGQRGRQARLRLGVQRMRWAEHLVPHRQRPRVVLRAATYSPRRACRSAYSARTAANSGASGVSRPSQILTARMASCWARATRPRAARIAAASASVVATSRCVGPRLASRMASARSMSGSA